MNGVLLSGVSIVLGLFYMKNKEMFSLHNRTNRQSHMNPSRIHSCAIQTVYCNGLIEYVSGLIHLLRSKFDFAMDIDVSEG